jgi:hypothetical protein
VPLPFTLPAMMVWRSTANLQVKIQDKSVPSKFQAWPIPEDPRIRSLLALRFVQGQISPVNEAFTLS